MKFGVILLLTDRQDRSEALMKVADHVADCHTIAVGEPWTQTSAVIGLIIDVNPSCLHTRNWLRGVLQKFLPNLPPAIYLSKSTSLAALREAKVFGASLCLPYYSDPKDIVASLINHIAPGEALTEIMIRRAAERTGQFFRYLFSESAMPKIDMERVEIAVDPILDAIHVGGLTRWLDRIWTHDDITFQHCMLVAGLVAAFSAGIGLSAADQRRMTRGALVHDVGKTKIPKAILNKSGRLDPDEMDLMRTHATIGHEILIASAECDPTILALTRHHHEMLDGTGYPDNLSGEAIADPIRLLTICDIYAALIEHRPYKAPYPPAEAMRILHEMGDKLESGLVQAFGMAVAKMS